MELKHAKSSEYTFDIREINETAGNQWIIKEWARHKCQLKKYMKNWFLEDVA